MLRQGNVKLIGEPFPQLALGPNPGGPTSQQPLAGEAEAEPQPGPDAQPGPQGSLDAQLRHAAARFARIYGFSFEGHYYDLAKPVIMLVHGDGVALGAAPPTILESDEAARIWEFSRNLRQWNYDKLTMSIRLDIESGTIEQILLDAALVGTGWSYAGAKAGLAGAKVGGAKAGISGAKVGISGAKAGIRGDGWGD
jgi:hypothetical protein